MTWRDIEGWFSEEEAEFLLPYVTGMWCEIGCFNGRSTVAFAETGEPGYAIDHFKGSPEHPEGTDTREAFEKNMRSYPNVCVLPWRFEDAEPLVTYPLHFLHLDGEHSYEATRKAWNMYSVKVKRGGVVAFHDGKGGSWPDVERVVAEVRTNQNWFELGSAGRSVAFLRR